MLNYKPNQRVKIISSVKQLKIFLLKVLLVAFCMTIMHGFFTVAQNTVSAGVIDDELLQLAQSKDIVRILVYLRKQPTHRIAVEEKQLREIEINRTVEQVEELMQPFGVNDRVPDVIRNRVTGILLQQEALMTDMRRAIFSRIKAEIRAERETVQQFIEEELNGEVYAKITLVNALGASLSSDKLKQLANHPDVLKISSDQIKPVTPELNYSAQVINADWCWDEGYDGDGVLDVGIVDSGVAMNHPAFSGHRGGEHTEAGGGVGDYTTDDGHGTKVAGVVVSQNSTYKGIAKGIDKILNSKAFDYNGGSESETMEAVEWAVGETDDGEDPPDDPAEIINFSYGFDDASGYSDIAKFFDSVVDDLHIPVTKSAGKCTAERDITEPGDMYNGIVVGCIDDNNDSDRYEGEIYSTTPEGPVDSRKKPDLVAPGVNIMTTVSTYQSGPDFKSATGTSMAAPHVAGALAILHEYLGSPWPKELKAVLINTAETENEFNDSGDPEWDSAWGWGYIDLEEALSNWRHDEVSLNSSGSNFDTYYWSLNMSPGEKITMVWNRHVDFNYESPTVYDFNNVDLYIYDYNTDELLDSSTSTEDNVEQVFLSGQSQKQVLVKAVNNGDSTQAISVAFPSVFTREGHSHPAPQMLVVSTDDASSDVDKYVLGQNFPNPFNPETWIPYAIKKKAFVSIKIFDSKGQLVRTLDLGTKVPGKYMTALKAAHWDGKNEFGESVSSGVYFYYITAGDFAATRKMILLK